MLDTRTKIENNRGMGFVARLKDTRDRRQLPLLDRLLYVLGEAWK